MTVLRVGRSRVRVPLQTKDLFTKASNGLRGGGVSWRVSLKTRIHLVPTLRMCGVIPPLRLHSFVACVWTTRLGIRESKLQDSETCQVLNLKVPFSIVITINKSSMVGRASRRRGQKSRVVWRLNVWTREVAAGRNLNDGSFKLHNNLIT